MALDNKSLVSSANYLTDLNSTYSKSIVLYKNNILIPNGISHTIEATISYFDRTELIDKILILKAPVVINSNASMLIEIENILSEISDNIDDSIVFNLSAINGNDLVLDIGVSTDSTILKTLNIKVKYGNILKYDIDSTSNEYISILTNAGLNDINVITNINNIASQILPNLDEILLVDDKANEVSINTNLVSAMKSEVISIRDETIVNRDSSASSASSALDSKNSAFQKASEALTSANNADVSESNALASELLAEKWASENEDIIVADGKYSAKHYMLKAEEFASASLSTINDNEVKTVQTYSSSKIENDLNKIGFDLTADVAVSTGQIAWNNTEGTIDIGLENGSVLQAGQENIRKVTNNSGALISDGTLVMFNGTNGASGRINVKPFTAGFDEAIKLYGVSTQSISNGSDGIITIDGKVRGIDTTGASVGEVWNDEDILYAKPNDNGRMTKFAPADNELKIVVASVVKSHHTNGTLEIRFMPFNENAYYTKVQNDILLNNKVPIVGDFTLDLGEL